VHSLGIIMQAFFPQTPERPISFQSAHRYLPITSSPQAFFLPLPVPVPLGRPRFFGTTGASTEFACPSGRRPSALRSAVNAICRYSSSFSLRRVSSMTSSVVITRRPAWAEKVSRSRAVLAVAHEQLPRTWARRVRASYQFACTPARSRRR